MDSMLNNYGDLPYLTVTLNWKLNASTLSICHIWSKASVAGILQINMSGFSTFEIVCSYFSNQYSHFTFQFYKYWVFQTWQSHNVNTYILYSLFKSSCSALESTGLKILEDQEIFWGYFVFAKSRMCDTSIIYKEVM